MAQRLSSLRSLLTLAVGAGLVVMMGVQAVGANHEPADKAVAAGSDLQSTGPNQDPIAILSDTMRVSTTVDLMLHVTAECSILTSLLTGEAPGTSGETQSAYAFGQVKFFITVDGTRVPVSVNDTEVAEENPDGGDDFGEVVFCNRAYQRTVTDSEDAADGVDTQDDFIRTRTANAFNWLALNVGEDVDADDTDGVYEYDLAANGNNIVEVILWAEFTKDPPCVTEEGEPLLPRDDDSAAPYGQSCAEALIGSRTMIIEPTHASVHEQVQDQGGVGE